MEHIAIDLGGRQSQICTRAADGRILDERTRKTSELRQYLAKRPPSRVIVETCAEAFAVADIALELGHEVRVVPGTLVRSLGVGSRGVKTDRRDAQVLSEVSCRIDLPSVHVASLLARQRKTLCGMRESLVAARTQLLNTVHGWLRTQGNGVLKSGTPESFAARVHTFLRESLPTHVARQLETIEHLNTQIAYADRELKTHANQDADCRRLMSIPGVGPVTAIRFVAAIDEVGRFGNAHRVESYLGLVPGEHSSSERQRRTSITKAGAPALRRALVQAAWASRRARGDHPMVTWSLEVEKRRGKRIAIVALARKLVGVMFALLRDGSVYDAKRTARVMD